MTMNDKYYINIIGQQNGCYDLHKEGCNLLKYILCKKELGAFDNCFDALKEAKKQGFATANGCISCCRDCHFIQCSF